MTLYFFSSLNFALSVFMAKDKEPKRLCRCGCGNMISARAERRHRDGQVSGRIAAAQKSQTKSSIALGHLTQSIKSKSTSTSTSANIASSSRHVNDGIEQNFIRLPSPMDVSSDDTPILPDVEPDVQPDVLVTEETATAVPNGSVDNARAFVWTKWRAQRRKATVSDEEDNEDLTFHEDSDSEDELVGPVLPEDDEDSVDDSQSVDDRIEAEWEKEWAEMGLFYILH